MPKARGSGKGAGAPGAKTAECLAEVTATAPQVDLAVTLLCAARYALGRKSYAPGCVISVLRGNPHVLNKCQRELLAEEIRTAHEQDKEWRDSKKRYVSPNPWEWTDWLELADILDGGEARG